MSCPVPSGAMPIAPIHVYGPAATLLDDGRPQGLLGVALRIAALGTSVSYVAAAAVDPRSVPEPSAVILGSETLAEARGRTVSTAARKGALKIDVPVVVHVSDLAGGEPWAGDADPVAVTRALLPRATLVVAARPQALALTEADDPRAAAAALAAAGATLAVVTGEDETVLDGALQARAAGSPSLTALTAGLVASLAGSRWYPPAAAAALPHLCATQ